ncbi:ABC transporter substrate-binding protein [Microbacterium sp. C7(2022)]|uniref:ABC transporter substrate-binding protein n=1 Tax=Microbacterium sp. C7(2022) TaxID=2992759 RepID=UPI00237C1B42|nr:extracellular solute-binding protein [Microbacterium sp. C7(2022)]MDE0547612.1 extracellular solute-binding protein [Microbacterium sp. C7(2022)]
MKRRTGLAIAAMAITAMSLAACSSGDGGGSADGQAKLSILSWDGEAVMQPVIDAFEKANPDVTLDVSYSPPVQEYISTLQTRVLSGTAPDVFLIAAENKTNLIDGGHVLDLAGESFLDGIPDMNQRTYGRDGAVYGLSVSSWGSGIMYNVDMLKDVGWTEPPATWDEFLELCNALKDAGISTPYLEALDGIPTALVAFLGARDASQDFQMDAAIFDGSSSFEEEWTPALEQYNRLFTEGIETSTVAGIKPDQIIDEFAAGRVAMFPAGPWNVAGIREKAPDLNIAMMQVPGADGGEPYLAGAASPGWAINPKSENIDLAKTFLSFMASEEGISVYQEASNAITVTPNFDPVVDEAFAPLVPNIREGAFYLPQIAWTRAEDVLNIEATAQIQLMALGQATPEQVAAALDAKLAANPE